MVYIQIPKLDKLYDPFKTGYIGVGSNLAVVLLNHEKETCCWRGVCKQSVMPDDPVTDMDVTSETDLIILTPLHSRALGMLKVGAAPSQGFPFEPRQRVTKTFQSETPSKACPGSAAPIQNFRIRRWGKVHLWDFSGQENSFLHSSAGINTGLAFPILQKDSSWTQAVQEVSLRTTASKYKQLEKTG